MKYKKLRTKFIKGIAPKKREKENRRTLHRSQKFRLRLLVEDFKIYFAQNRPYLDEKFKAFFNRAFTLWDKSEYRIEFSQREYRILRYLGLKNDFVFVQLISDLGEFGLDLQTFLVLCLEALLNKDEQFVNVLYDMILKKKGELGDKNGKEIFNKIKEKREKDLRKFEKFSFQVNE